MVDTEREMEIWAKVKQAQAERNRNAQVSSLDFDSGRE